MSTSHLISRIAVLTVIPDFSQEATIQINLTGSQVEVIFDQLKLMYLTVWICHCVLF